jgi:hypothetical protein
MNAKFFKRRDSFYLFFATDPPQSIAILLILIILLLVAAVGEWTVLEITSPAAYPQLPLRQRIFLKTRELNF